MVNEHKLVCNECGKHIWILQTFHVIKPCPYCGKGIMTRIIDYDKLRLNTLTNLSDILVYLNFLKALIEKEIKEEKDNAMRKRDWYKNIYSIEE